MEASEWEEKWDSKWNLEFKKKLFISLYESDLISQDLANIYSKKWCDLPCLIKVIFDAIKSEKLGELTKIKYLRLQNKA